MKKIDELLEERNKHMISETNIDQTVANTDTNTIETVVEDTKIESQEVTGYSSNEVIELLKKSLNIHWQQTTSLTDQALQLERSGYKKLADIHRKDAEEEHQHAIINIRRLEFFDVDYQPLVVSPPTWTRHNMVALIQYNLDSAREAAAAERATITAARAVGDELTANIMIPLLQGSEDGIQLYESYLKLIDQIGIDNFLTLQV